MHRSLLFAPLLLTACVTPVSLEGLADDLARTSLVAEVRPDSKPATALTLVPMSERLEASLPEGPLRVAVAPPVLRVHGRSLLGGGRRHDAPRFGAWSKEELESIARIEVELARQGLVKEILPLPTLALEVEGALMGKRQLLESGSWLESGRRSALLQGYDVILFLNSAERYGGRDHLLSILDLTVVGAFVFESHTREARSLIEAVALDTRSGAVVLTEVAEGHAQDTLTLADAYSDEERILEEARLAALDDLGRRMARRLVLTH